MQVAWQLPLEPLKAPLQPLLDLQSTGKSIWQTKLI